MFARPRASDVEESPFSFVDIVQFRFVGGVGHALVEWQNALVASHHDDRTKFQTLGLARLICAVTISLAPTRRSIAARARAKGGGVRTKKPISWAAIPSPSQVVTTLRTDSAAVAMVGKDLTSVGGPSNTETIPRRSSSTPSRSRRTVGKSRSAAQRIC